MSALGNKPATDLRSSEVGTDGVLGKDSQARCQEDEQPNGPRAWCAQTGGENVGLAHEGVFRISSARFARASASAVRPSLRSDSE